MTKKGSDSFAAAPPVENLISVAKEASKSRGLPPVELWDSPFCGDLDMEIRRNGTWFHQGTPIGRPALVRLFSTILRRDGDAYFLVTPVEKVGIRVEDAPFVAIDANAAGSGRDQAITFTTNVGDSVTAGPDHPIRLHHDAGTGEPAPYVLVRRNLEALIDRKTFYRLSALGARHRHRGEDWFGFWSGGTFFPAIPARDLA
ncbi:MAG: DUF1285 domain-containing protein [Tropicimonas sp.]|uniref:DUF1285 domain-containing protein n=1 Tax=Tropicimonas sp. TaxID=2067044 RepID=UPI003A839644